MGLRWWNEVDSGSGDSHWVFESAPQPNEPGGKLVNATDKRFFWLALYCQPALWVALAIVAVVRLEFIWLTLVGEWMCSAGACLMSENERCGLTVSSHRIGPHDHEHARLLPLRQVQPSKWFGRARSVLWKSGSQRWRSAVLALVQQINALRTTVRTSIFNYDAVLSMPSALKQPITQSSCHRPCAFSPSLPSSSASVMCFNSHLV